jgi:hypothetical protein
MIAKKMNVYTDKNKFLQIFHLLYRTKSLLYYIVELHFENAKAMHHDNYRTKHKDTQQQRQQEHQPIQGYNQTSKTKNIAIDRGPVNS